MARTILAAAAYTGAYRSEGGRIACHIEGFGRLDRIFSNEDNALCLVDDAISQAGLDDDEATCAHLVILRALEIARAAHNV